ncbi:MAG: hypothetical protein H0V39_02145 [Nitrosomonas sp.]|nr:hypothetical protein [Nitrosomonas sp.]
MQRNALESECKLLFTSGVLPIINEAERAINLIKVIINSGESFRIGDIRDPGGGMIKHANQKKASADLYARGFGFRSIRIRISARPSRAGRDDKNENNRVPFDYCVYPFSRIQDDIRVRTLPIPVTPESP